MVEILEDDNVYGGTCGLLGARPSNAQKCAISFSDPIFSLQLDSIIYFYLSIKKRYARGEVGW